MGNAIVGLKLQHLWVDQQQLDFTGLGGKEDTEQHRIQADALAGPGSAGHQEMRHCLEICRNRCTEDVLPQSHCQSGSSPTKRVAHDDFAQRDGFSRTIRHFDPHHRFSGQRRNNSQADRFQRQCEVIGQIHDTGYFRSRRRLKLIHRHNRARPHLRHGAVNPKASQCTRQDLGLRLQLLIRHSLQWSRGIA